MRRRRVLCVSTVERARCATVDQPVVAISCIKVSYDVFLRWLYAELCDDGND